MAVYTTNPQQLGLFASVTLQAFVDYSTGAPVARPHTFTNGDNIQGYVYVVDQPAPTTYNFYKLTLVGTSLALTDGMGIKYAVASGLGYVPSPYPYITFTLNVTSSALDTALAAAVNIANINAFLEFRCVLTGTPTQTEVICNDPVQIWKTALFP